MQGSGCVATHDLRVAGINVPLKLKELCEHQIVEWTNSNLVQSQSFVPHVDHWGEHEDPGKTLIKG